MKTHFTKIFRVSARKIFILSCAVLALFPGTLSAQIYDVIDVVAASRDKLALFFGTEGTGLSEHAAPGDALVFALEGKATIGYEGQEYPISAGENFHFAAGGRHSVRAEGRFKMALLLML